MAYYRQNQNALIEEGGGPLDQALAIDHGYHPTMEISSIKKK